MWSLRLMLLATVCALSACSAYSRQGAVRDVVYGDPESAPVATRMTPALQCLSSALARDPGRKVLDVWVMPFATSAGMTPDAPWQKTIDALQKAAPPGLDTIRVRDGRADWDITAPVPSAAFFDQPSITGRVVLERDLVARDVDVALEGAYYVTAALGIAADETVDRMEVSIYFRAGDRTVSPLSATVSAVYRSTVDNAFDAQVAVVDAGGLGAAGGVLRVTSKEQILRHLVETGVFSLLTRLFNRGTECLTSSAQWTRWRDEYHRLDDAGRVRVKRLLMQRMGDHAMPGVTPVWDQSLTIDEYVAARSQGVIADADLAPPSTTPTAADVPAAAPVRVAAPVPVAAPGGRLYVVNGRLITGEDGFVECFAVDASSTRVQRLDVDGREFDGRIRAHRAYRVAFPSQGFARAVCYRTGASLLAHLPTTLRERAPVSIPWEDVRRLFEDRGWKVGRVEETL